MSQKQVVGNFLPFDPDRNRQGNARQIPQIRKACGIKTERHKSGGRLNDFQTEAPRRPETEIRRPKRRTRKPSRCDQDRLGAKSAFVRFQKEAAIVFFNFFNPFSETEQGASFCRIFEKEIADCRGEGLVVPFTDSPLDDEPVGENVYLNIINSAEDYVYITTPYLVIDNEMQTALILAAKSGIDVRIITPHIPDKWFVFAVTRAHYRKLVKYGVKIYEYTPGFIHAKNFVSDDKAAVVGTINLDFRSLYLHFECASWMYKCECIPDIKRDYLETLKVCQEITYSDCIHINIFKRIGRAILRLFAPMM